MADFWDIVPCSLVQVSLIIQAVRISETSVYFNVTTRCYITESCHLHTRRHEKLKSHEDTIWYSRDSVEYNIKMDFRCEGVRLNSCMIESW
jgi:hypothetical protein